jgi:hypothetical protein
LLLFFVFVAVKYDVSIIVVLSCVFFFVLLHALYFWFPNVLNIICRWLITSKLRTIVGCCVVAVVFPVLMVAVVVVSVVFSSSAACSPCTMRYTVQYSNVQYTSTGGLHVRVHYRLHVLLLVAFCHL